jgi:preprotein translocase subunit SecF
MFIIKYRNIFFIITALLVAFSIFAMVSYGFNFGIDFKGGSIVEVSYPGARPNADLVKASLDKLNLGAYSLRPSGEKNYALRTKELSEDAKINVLKSLSLDNTAPLKEERFNTIGPVVGKELTHKAYIAILLAILGIVLFVTFAFRKVSEPVASWKYGLTTIVALAHDVIVPAGIFVAWSHFRGGEIDLLFVTALLAILGYSVHDTIVVFDRVRENLRLNREYKSKDNFETTVGKSVSQTFGRSINTSLTIFLVLVALYFIGGQATRDFALVLLIGVIAGTYSSIFLASPLLVALEKLQKK